MAEVIYVLSGEIAWFDHFRQFGDQFEKPFDRAVSILEKHPEIAPVFGTPPFRRLALSQTTWGVFYTVEGSRVVIHTILDLRQDPERIRFTLENLLP